MNKKSLKPLLIAFAFVMVLYPSLQAQAKVHSFSTLNMEVNVPEDTIILTKDTPNSDAQWAAAKILDPKSEKESFQKMGVQAILYDPNTATTVRLMQKQTSESQEVFHFSLLSDDELTTYLDNLFTSSDENTTYTMDRYAQPETPFYRLSLSMTKEGVLYSEIIYGTIVNGYSIAYDIYAENNTEPLVESYITELVAGTHFTEFLDKAEVEQQQREATIILMIALGILIGILVVWILLRRKASNKQKVIKLQKADELAHFFTEQRLREEQNIRDTSLFTNKTKYTQEILKNFYIYDRVLKHLKLWIISAIIYLLFLSNFFASGSYLGFALTIIVLGVFLYYQSFQIEKIVTRTMKAYKSNKSTEAVFTFYEGYYTLSGIQSSSKYPYVQITEVKQYKDCIYLYLGADKAHYLKKDGFEQELVEFEKFIKEQTKRK